MRKEASIINLIYAYIGQFVGVIISFISRIVFIKVLNSEYLGINSLFTNIITFLSFAELGIGAAMTFSLYEPLSKNDTEKIKSLMSLYKKSYFIIGTVVLIIGVSLTPFLKYIIKEMPDISGIKIYYILFVINSAVSYFYSYKRSLIICDQKRYLATFYRYLCYFLVNLTQIIVLLITKNYFLYLICQIIYTLIENILVSRKVEQLYPYIKEKNVKKIDTQTSEKIFRDIKAAFLNKIGLIVIKSTDSIVISKFLGVVCVGIYSNYAMIITSLNTIINQIFTSITASVGNFSVTESNENLKKLFDRIYFLNYIVYGIVTVCLFNVTNIFIELWIGKEYLLSFEIVIAIIISFYISGIRVSIITIKDAMGLYWQDKYRPVLGAIVNLIISVILVNKIGLNGVIIGTIVSSIFVDLIIEPYFLYKYTFKTSVKEYYLKYILYFGIVILGSIITLCLLKFVLINNIILNFLIKGIISFILGGIILIIPFYKSENFSYIIDLIKLALNLVLNKIKKKNVN